MGKPRPFVLTLARIRGSRAVHLVLTFGLAQLAIAVGAILRVPLTVEAIGIDGLGSVLVVGAVVPVLLIPGTGLRVTARTLIAEDLARGGHRMRDVNRQGVRLANRLGIGLAAAAGLLIPFDVLHLGPSRSMLFAVVATVGLSVASLDGLWYWGCLEAMDKAHLPNVAVIAVTIGGLLAAVALAATHAPTEGFILLNVATSTMPFYVISIVGRRASRRGASSPTDCTYPMHDLPRAVRNTSVRGLTGALARGSEPFVLNSMASTTAIGVFTVAQRLGSGITLIALAVLPRLALKAAERRSRDEARTFGEVVGLMRRTLVLALVPMVGYLAVAPQAVRMLAGREAVGPASLYLIIALAALLLAVESPLEGTLSGASSQSATRVPLLLSGVTTLGVSIVGTNYFGVLGPGLGAICGTALLILLELRVLRRTTSTGDRLLWDT